MRALQQYDVKYTSASGRDKGMIYILQPDNISNIADSSIVVRVYIILKEI